MGFRLQPSAALAQCVNAEAFVLVKMAHLQKQAKLVTNMIFKRY